MPDIASVSDQGLVPESSPAKPQPQQPKRAVRTPKLGDYLRVFSYATRWDFVTYAVAAVASVGAGITLPFMIIIFGRLAGDVSESAAMEPRRPPEVC